MRYLATKHDNYPLMNSLFSNLEAHIPSSTKELSVPSRLLLTVDFDRAIEPVIRAPITEVVLFFLRSQDESWLNTIQEFERFISTSAKGYHTASRGWDANTHQLSIEGPPTYCCITIAGWDSVEAHEAFREREDCQAFLKKLMTPDVELLTWYHFEFK